MKKNKPELLLPAGDLGTLEIAFAYGADAVYVGGEEYSLRKGARNFSKDDLAKGISYAHGLGKKVYVAVNIFAHNDDLKGLDSYFGYLSDIGADAVLVSDMGVLDILRNTAPGLEFHISTQANNVNYRTFAFYHSLGAKRVVCGRELSLSEIRKIRENIPDDLEIEAFVHGAMCMAYSGRCLLSNYLTHRDANRGECTHPCRWGYGIAEKQREGEYFDIEEDSRGTYILNSKDLCMIDHVDALVDAGIDSFKIEGRMKSELYIATMARVYRRAIDTYFESPNIYKTMIHELITEAMTCTHRDYSTGFFFGPAEDGNTYGKDAYIRGATYLGMIERTDDAGRGYFTQKNKFSVGDEIQVMKPCGEDFNAKVLSMVNEDGKEVSSCPHSKEGIWIDLGNAGLTRYDIMRRKG